MMQGADNVGSLSFGSAMGDAFKIERVRGRVRTLRVVLGDQLDGSALRTLDRERDALLMMEVEGEATHVPSHRQRTVLFLSAMRHFALEQAGKGWRLRYVRLDDPSNTQSLDSEVRRAVEALAPARLEVVVPGDHRVAAMVRGWEASCLVEMIEDDHFLTSRKDFDAWAEGRRELVMEYFYRDQRKRLGLLMDGGKPVGGAWNYDKENRQAFNAQPDVPSEFRARPDEVTREVMELVASRFGDAPGGMAHFRWPVTRQEARRALARFVETRLARFGPYEDAMWAGEAFLYHSALSASLNLKLLNPRECVEAAIDAYEAGDAPLNSVEGFVRQLIGWREFIRGVYFREGPAYADRNALDQHGQLPALYWSGETDMACMRECVGSVVEHAYAHHIPRLMVMGNFALISGVHPKRISDWFLAMFVDGVDWVTLPNTLGMAMHADGGVVGTKPYAGSGKYIKRMSNLCDGCRYDVNKRVGEDACPFNTFYWAFLVRTRERFKGNTRMAMILKNVDRMSKGERVELTREGERLQEAFGIQS